MSAMIHAAYDSPVSVRSPISSYDDPLDEDCETDVPVIATRRGLARLALIAAKTGARFQRDGEGTDAMGWLLAPRRLFGGAAAIEAVLCHDNFMRALVLHGLSVGLDAEPGFIDEIIGTEDDDDIYDDEQDGDGDNHPSAVCGADESSDDAAVDDDRGGWFSPPRLVDVSKWAHLSAVDSAGGGANHGPRLITATLVHHDGRSTLQVFHASVCRDPMEAFHRLSARYGLEAASDAEINFGFDPSTTFAEALVSPAISDLLQLVDAEPRGPLAAGLNLNLEQRFAV